MRQEIEKVASPLLQEQTKISSLLINLYSYKIWNETVIYFLSFQYESRRFKIFFFLKPSIYVSRVIN